MTLAESIYFYRKRAGLSQEALAERVGVSRQAVSRWELGDATPEVSKLVALAEAFGITTDQLLRGEGVEPEGEQPPAAEEQAQETPRQSELPGMLGRLVRRHGWLAGVYIALEGLGVAVVGGIARFAFGRMFRIAVNDFGSIGGFGPMGGMTFTDASGAVVSLPPEVADAIQAEIGGGGFSGGLDGPVSMISGVGEIFLGIANIFILLGVLTMLAGAILAAYLYRKGRGK